MNAAATFAAEDRASGLASGAGDPEGPAADPLNAFLAHAALEAGEHQAAEGREALQLMTVHSAKGLEFPVVLICGLEEGIFPHESSLRSDEELAEERRLAYVAVTRARERLYLTCAQQRMHHGKTQHGIPSRFLADLPRDRLVVDRPSLEASAARLAPARARRERDEHSQVIEYDDFDQSVPDEEPFWVGQRVRHRVLGVGEVRACHGRGGDVTLAIEFPEAGLKTIKARFVTPE